MATPSPSSTKSVFVTPPPKRQRVQGEGIAAQVGCTILLTGLCKAGKTTISNEVSSFLGGHGYLVKQLDGKKLRSGICSKLDFDNLDDRSEFVRLAGESAKLITEMGYISLVSIVAPLEKDRKTVRESHENDGMRFLEVFVDRPRKDCAHGLERNVLNQIDGDYQTPTTADVHLRRSGDNVSELTTQLINELILYKIIPPIFNSPQSPQSPLSPFGTISSPSTSATTFNSSGLESEFDDDDDGVTSATTPFKLPQKGSALLTIFNYVKSVMIMRGYKGGGVASAYTHSDKFFSGPLYQPTLTGDEIEIANSITNNWRKDVDVSKMKGWTPDEIAKYQDQLALFKRVEADCTRKEGLGIAALIIAEMKGQSHNDILIQRDNKIYEHINSFEEGDLLYIQNVFKFLTGRSLTINVDHCNKLELKDMFL
ncbi:uncharacterized protein LOC110848501 [Folsomia candida]|uniref:uncharacterized protein LOC110848501 n=1 Tax=Folsomia candida TaxID=158441 RepID=UPI001604E061|nr:uncharacterized protein LOC110848501 [Folsomia candida]